MLRIKIHRGAKQIGGTCIELAHQGTRIALDLGMPLDGKPGDQGLLPPIAGDGLAAILISHPHLDHYGVLPLLSSNIPVAMGAAAKRIVQAAAPFTRQPLPNLAGPELRDRQPLEIGPFRVTPYLVDHSAFDAYALLIEAGGKRVFYSGDFRAHGRKSGLFEQLIGKPPRDIDVLLMEGSSLSRLEEDDRFPSETELEHDLIQSLKGQEGLAMVHASAQNIDRIVTLFRVAKQTERTFVIDLYSAAILAATGHPSIPQSDWEKVTLYVPEAQRLAIKQNGWFDLLKSHSRHRIFKQGLEAISAKAIILYRPLLMRDLSSEACLKNARFFYSQWSGYLEQGSYASTQAWLKDHGIQMDYWHTSGHAAPADLKRFAQALAPKSLVPIHSFAPEQYPKLFDNVTPHNDGEWWDVG